MKLEKRDITLNEYDSLKDTFYMEKLDTLRYLLGADVDAVVASPEQIQKVIDKKNELENSIAERSFSAISTFMEKEGYKVDSPEKMLTDVSGRLQSGDDPIDILKDTAKPFIQIAKDTLAGNHSVSFNDIGSAINTDKNKGIINQKANEFITSAKDAYYSTKYDKKAVEAARNGDLSYDISSLNEDTALRTNIAILADKKVSDKVKDQVEERIKEIRPDVAPEDLYNIRSGKYNDAPINSLNNSSTILTIKEDAGKLLSDLKEKSEPVINEGKTLFGGLKESVKDMGIKAPEIKIKESIPITTQEIKSTAKTFLNESSLLEPLREKEEEKAKQREQNMWTYWQIVHNKFDYDAARIDDSSPIDPNKQNKLITDLQIDPNIPDNIKRLLDKYKITGGN